MCSDMVEVDRQKFMYALESLQRKVPRVCRNSFEKAFEVAIAIEAQRCKEVCEEVKYMPNQVRSQHIQEKAKQKMEENIAYLQVPQKEALEYYDGKR